MLTPASTNVLTRAPIVSAPASVIPDLGHLPHAPAGNRDLKTGQFLRFEDLLKNCAKPAWVLDPRSVVFCASNRQVSGAEQFRTLRTRLYNLPQTSPLRRGLVNGAFPAQR